MMSWNVMFSRFSFKKSMSRSKWFASAVIMALLLPNSRTTRAAPTKAVRSHCCFARAASRRTGPRFGAAKSLGEYRLDLGLERLRVERLDDVVVHASLLCRDDVLGLGFGGHHDEWGLGETGVGTNFLEQLVAGHRLHVPIGNHEPVFLVAHLDQR